MPCHADEWQTMTPTMARARARATMDRHAVLQVELRTSDGAQEGQSSMESKRHYASYGAPLWNGTF